MTHELTTEERARQIVDEFTRTAGSRRDVENLRRQIAGALAAAVDSERDRCAGLCEERAQLWARTGEREPSTPLREEARCRANEARYLADAIAYPATPSGQEPGWVF